MRYWRDHKYFSWRTKFHCESWGNQFRNEFFLQRKIELLVKEPRERFSDEIRD